MFLSWWEIISPTASGEQIVYFLFIYSEGRGLSQEQGWEQKACGDLGILSEERTEMTYQVIFERADITYQVTF